MKIGDLFPSRFFKASDLAGREAAVTISHVEIEQIQAQGGAESKGVVYFSGQEKGLVLNQVNARTIAAVFGDDLENWTNRQIVLFSTTTQFGGRLVPCIRVRIPAAPAPVPAAPAAPPAAPAATGIDAANAELGVPASSAEFDVF